MSSEQPAKFPRAERIRQEFQVLGGRVGTRVLAEHLLTTGIFDEEWHEQAALKAAQKEIRDALKAPDAAGLPFACSVGRGSNAIFSQRSFLSYVEYDQVIRDLADGLQADYQSIMLLHAECRQRYGRAPEIPALVLPRSWTTETAD